MIQLDVLPTALAAAGVVAPKPSAKLDGVDLLPFLTGNDRPARRTSAVLALRRQMAIRSGRLEAGEDPRWSVHRSRPSVLRDLSGAELFNLANDIGETRDRAADRPDKVKELGDLWQQWNRQLSRPLWGPPAGSADAADAENHRTVSARK